MAGQFWNLFCKSHKDGCNLRAHGSNENKPSNDAIPSPSGKLPQTQHNTVSIMGWECPVLPLPPNSWTALCLIKVDLKRFFSMFSVGKCINAVPCYMLSNAEWVYSVTQVSLHCALPRSNVLTADLFVPIIRALALYRDWPRYIWESPRQAHIFNIQPSTNTEPSWFVCNSGQEDYPCPRESFHDSTGGSRGKGSKPAWSIG